MEIGVPRRWRDYQIEHGEFAGLDLASEASPGGVSEMGISFDRNHPEATVEIEGGVTAIVHAYVNNEIAFTPEWRRACVFKTQLC